MTQERLSIFWFRRDLRLIDNAGLYHALKGENKVLPIFIFDEAILEKLEDKQDRRVEFIYQRVQQLKEQLRSLGCDLLILKGRVEAVFENLLATYSIQAVYTNHDYEPQAIERDTNIEKLLARSNMKLLSFKDQVIFEKAEVTKEDGSPYTVFTPYMKKWKSSINEFFLKSYPTEKYFNKLLQFQAPELFPLTALGFQVINSNFPSEALNTNLIKNYHETRDIPSLHGTSRLSVHLRFGTISIRQLTRDAIRLNEKWWNELIWREFYMMILYHFPHVVSRAFKPSYDRIVWKNDSEDFQRWCEGKTGYPIVDAGMRELNETGFMHNRVRMIVASFLVKHLLIDWKWGEAYFAKKLLDFELSSNNGGWQWAASSGCDAAPYFRIFNPYEQSKRFDPQGKYIRQWIPELDSLDYPLPLVDHKMARERVLKTYKEALNKDGILKDNVQN